MHNLSLASLVVTFGRAGTFAVPGESPASIEASRVSPYIPPSSKVQPLTNTFSLNQHTTLLAGNHISLTRLGFCTRRPDKLGYAAFAGTPSRNRKGGSKGAAHWHFCAALLRSPVQRPPLGLPALAAALATPHRKESTATEREGKRERAEGAKSEQSELGPLLCGLSDLRQRRLAANSGGE